MRAKVNSTASVLGAFVALLLSACSSKNPDSLVGMNVDENLAIMDANASSNAIAAATNVEAHDASAEGASNRPEISGEAGPPRASARESMDAQDRSTAVKAIESNDAAADQDQAGATLNTNDEATPNAI